MIQHVSTLHNKRNGTGRLSFHVLVRVTGDQRNLTYALISTMEVYMVMEVNLPIYVLEGGFCLWS